MPSTIQETPASIDLIDIEEAISHAKESTDPAQMLKAGYAIKMKLIEAERLLKHQRLGIQEHYESMWVAKTPAETKAKNETIDEQAYIDRLENNYEMLIWLSKVESK